MKFIKIFIVLTTILFCFAIVSKGEASATDSGAPELPGQDGTMSQPSNPNPNPTNLTKVKIKVLTLNMHGGVNWYNRFDLDAFAKLINDLNPDLVGLQEVDRFWSSMSQFSDIPGELALKTKMFPAYSVSRERNNGFFGNLILSKYPIMQMWAEDMPGNLERRSFISTQVNINGIKVNFITTHLGLSVSDRVQQVTAMMDFVDRLEGPLILVGDLNGDIQDPAVKLLTQSFTEWQDASNYKGQGTFRAKNGVVSSKMDYIFTTPEFSFENFVIIDSYVSDHLPVMAEVSLMVSAE